MRTCIVFFILRWRWGPWLRTTNSSLLFRVHSTTLLHSLIIAIPFNSTYLTYSHFTLFPTACCRPEGNGHHHARYSTRRHSNNSLCPASSKPTLRLLQPRSSSLTHSDLVLVAAAAVKLLRRHDQATNLGLFCAPLTAPPCP